METLKIGDIITFIGDDIEKTVHKEEVRGIAGNLLFTRTLIDTLNGAKFGPTELLGDIEDLITFGWKLTN